MPHDALTKFKGIDVDQLASAKSIDNEASVKFDRLQQQ